MWEQQEEEVEHERVAEVENNEPEGVGKVGRKEEDENDVDPGKSLELQLQGDAEVGEERPTSLKRDAKGEYEDYEEEQEASDIDLSDPFPPVNDGSLSLDEATKTKTLFSTTLDPERRRLLQVQIPDAEQAHRTITDLLGDDPSARFRFIMERAAEVEMLDV